MPKIMETVNLNYLVAILFIAIFAVACTKKETSEYPILSSNDLDTLTLSKSLKGWELYSWPVNNNWYYSLLIGTNRAKNCSEIKENKITVSGTDNLKLLLTKLPEGENLVWISKDRCSTCDDCRDLSLPQSFVQEEIKDFCDTINIKCYISIN
jgi:hypothetical protein